MVSVATKILKGEDFNIFFEYDGKKIFVVSDGHSGKQCASLSIKLIKKLIDTHSISEIFKTIHDTVEDYSGCSITVCIYDSEQKKIKCWNCGDSVALLVFSSVKTVILTTNHRLCFNPSEREILKSKGANISDRGTGMRVWPGGLNMSRSLGDKDCPYLSREPSISEYDIEGACTLVMCSDGVTDSLSLEKISKITSNAHSIKYVADRLVNSALKNGILQDDATALVFDIGDVYRKKTSWTWLSRSPSNSGNSSNSDDETVNWTLKVNTDD